MSLIEAWDPQQARSVALAGKRVNAVLTLIYFKPLTAKPLFRCR